MHSALSLFSVPAAYRFRRCTDSGAVEGCVGGADSGAQGRAESRGEAASA